MPIDKYKHCYELITKNLIMRPKDFKDPFYSMNNLKSNNDLYSVVCSDKVCSHKGDEVKMPYLEWMEFAESETAKGNKQIECMTCLRWFWPSEF